jgi:hypothetical protein
VHAHYSFKQPCIDSNLASKLGAVLQGAVICKRHITQAEGVVAGLDAATCPPCGAVAAQPLHLRHGGEHG